MTRFVISYVCLCISSSFLLADDWNGIEYAQNSSVQSTQAERLLNSISLRGDECILDLGCGDGKFTAQLAKKVPLGCVAGVDPSPSMLDTAEKVRQTSGLDNLFFQKGCAESFSLSKQFDHVISIQVMHWVKEQEEALNNIQRHLKPHGHVHLLFSASKEGLPFHTALLKTLKNWESEFADFVNPQQVYDMETYRKLVVKAGLHIDSIHYVYHESHHANREKLQAWIKQWLPHPKHLPISAQLRFLNELLDNYLMEMGIVPETDAPINWGEYILIVKAQKP